MFLGRSGNQEINFFFRISSHPLRWFPLKILVNSMNSLVAENSIIVVGPFIQFFLMTLAIGFFYGSSSLDGAVCACGAILKLLDGVVFLLRLNVGSDINSNCELLGLWMLLFFS